MNDHSICLDLTWSSAKSVGDNQWIFPLDCLSDGSSKRASDVCSKPLEWSRLVQQVQFSLTSLSLSSAGQTSYCFLALPRASTKIQASSAHAHTRLARLTATVRRLESFSRKFVSFDLNSWAESFKTLCFMELYVTTFCVVSKSLAPIQQIKQTQPKRSN